MQFAFMFFRVFCCFCAVRACGVWPPFVVWFHRIRSVRFLHALSPFTSKCRVQQAAYLCLCSYSSAVVRFLALSLEAHTSWRTMRYSKGFWRSCFFGFKGETPSTHAPPITGCAIFVLMFSSFSAVTSEAVAAFDQRSVRFRFLSRKPNAPCTSGLEPILKQRGPKRVGWLVGYWCDDRMEGCCRFQRREIACGMYMLEKPCFGDAIRAGCREHCGQLNSGGGVVVDTYPGSAIACVELAVLPSFFVFLLPGTTCTCV